MATNALKLLMEPKVNDTSFWKTSTTGTTSSSSSMFSSSIASILFRATLIFIIVMLVLIFVHYTIRPVFKTTVDSPGIIPTPVLQLDDKVYWQKKALVSPISVAETPIGSSASGSGYSLSIDIEIDDANQYTNLPRILFYKGGMLRKIEPSPSVTVASMVHDLSLVLALTRETNDLQVAVVTSHNNLEGVLLNNVPLRTPFRVGIVVSDNRLEVYTNGMLSRTRALGAPPKASGSAENFWPSPTRGVQLRNLHIWPAVISPGDMRGSTPALSDANFDKPSLQETASCPIPYART